MYETKNVSGFIKDEHKIINLTVDVEIPLICQHCKNTGKQVFTKAACTFGDYDDYKLISITACAYCGSNSVHYHSYLKEGDNDKLPIVSSYPKFVSFNEIPQEISDKYTNFSTIYKQSVDAEQNNLDQLAGMGYRKALEFLITDYLIELNPDDRTTLENPKTTLNSKINKLPAEDLKDFAKASSWLGNDETHYTRLHPDLGTDDLKSFIDLVIVEIHRDLRRQQARVLIGKNNPTPTDKKA